MVCPQMRWQHVSTPHAGVGVRRACTPLTVDTLLATRPPCMRASTQERLRNSHATLTTLAERSRASASHAEQQQQAAATSHALYASMSAPGEAAELGTVELRRAVNSK